MGMPTLFYRFWYGANTLRLLKRNILHFISVKPVRETLLKTDAGAKAAAMPHSTQVPHH